MSEWQAPPDRIILRVSHNTKVDRVFPSLPSALKTKTPSPQLDSNDGFDRFQPEHYHGLAQLQAYLVREDLRENVPLRQLVH